MDGQSRRQTFGTSFRLHYVCTILQKTIYTKKLKDRTITKLLLLTFNDIAKGDCTKAEARRMWRMNENERKELTCTEYMYMQVHRVPCYYHYDSYYEGYR